MFCTCTGNYLYEKIPNNTNKSICTKINVTDVNIHALKHAYGTTLISNSVDPKTVQVLLGHADARTTFNNYVHATHEGHQKAANTIEKIYNPE